MCRGFLYACHQTRPLVLLIIADCPPLSLIAVVTPVLTFAGQTAFKSGSFCVYVFLPPPDGIYFYAVVSTVR